LEERVGVGEIRFGKPRQGIKMAEPVNIFIGFDTKEVVAYHVLCHSIIKHSSVPVRFTPVYLQHIANIFSRKRSELQSTEFSFSRFLVPYLSEYRGWSLFVDCDVLAVADIAELFELRNDSYSVMVCKHDYIPKDSIKFLGNVQTRYEKKNWSSVVLFNNSRCKTLTTDYVNRATGLELHQFKWLKSEDEIGALPLEWNWLVGEYPFNTHAKMVHFTRGGPYFNDYKTSDYADEWFAGLKEATTVRQN
jgi:lipopolysaccharide biosynthesis glycosyltransferase